MDTSICAFNCKELVVFVPGSQMYLCQAHKCICSRITNVMPSHYRLMLLQSLLSTNHYEFLISLHDRSSQSRTKGPVARATKSCLEILFSLIILSIYEIYIFASLFKVWWFPRAPWRDLIGNSNLPSRRSTQLFLVFARRLRLLSLPFLSFFRTICYFLTVIYLAEIAKSGLWKWKIKKNMLYPDEIYYKLPGMWMSVFYLTLPQASSSKLENQTNDKFWTTKLRDSSA